VFGQQSILIIEDEPLIAMDLASQIEVLDGRVVGPASTVAEALALLEEQPVTAAILDAKLADRDITPVGLVLAGRGIPFIVHSGAGIPKVLALALPSLRLVRKPAPAHIVIAHLLATMAGD
jgi:DNA-binding response OmpR family regulator